MIQNLFSNLDEKTGPTASGLQSQEVVMTRVADDKLGKFARQQWDMFRRARDSEEFLQRAKRMHRALLGTFLVPFDPSRPWDELVKAGKYGGVYIALNFNPAFHLPPLPAMSGEIEITLRKQDMITTTREWLSLLDNNPNGGQRFAHPLIVLAIGAYEPDEQRDAPIFVVWRDTSGQPWCLILDEAAGSRSLGVHRGRPVGGWNANYRAAAVAM